MIGSGTPRSQSNAPRPKPMIPSLLKVPDPDHASLNRQTRRRFHGARELPRRRLTGTGHEDGAETEETLLAAKGGHWLARRSGGWRGGNKRYDCGSAIPSKVGAEGHRLNNGTSPSTKRCKRRCAPKGSLLLGGQLGRPPVGRCEHVVRRENSANRPARGSDATGRDRRQGRNQFRAIFHACGARRTLPVRA